MVPELATEEVEAGSFMLLLVSTVAEIGSCWRCW